MTQQARPCLLVQLSKGIITMATHDIKFSIPEKDLGNVDISFSIKEDGKQLGTLGIGIPKMLRWQKALVGRNWQNY